MKLRITVAAVAAAVLAQPAVADRYYGHSYYSPRPAYAVVAVAEPGYAARGRGTLVHAQVIDVQPIIRHVTVSTPVRECWDETVYREPNVGTGAIIAGGILGGIFGHQFGSGSGNDVATVAGAVVGSTVAHNVAQRNAPPPYAETVQRCDTRSELRQEERIEGYNVTFVHDGQKYRTRTREHPGDEIAVRVAVTPVAY